MMNHTDKEETLSKQSEVIVRLEKEIQNQNQKIIDMEQKHSENIDSMKRSMLESLDMIRNLLIQGDTMRDECHEEFKELKDMNSNISLKMKCIKKEHEQMSKELKENKALNDLQQKKFTELIQKNVTKISFLRMTAARQRNNCKYALKLARELQDQNTHFNEFEPVNKRQKTQKDTDDVVEVKEEEASEEESRSEAEEESRSEAEEESRSEAEEEFRYSSYIQYNK